MNTINIDGIEVHIEGDGEHTVVMIHGWPDTWRVWDAQVAHLAPRLRCVRFTLPGFDVHAPRRPMSLDEMLAFFGKVIDATCGGRPAILLLHDWGAVFGYQFALRHPQRVLKVIGVDIGDANSPAHLKSLSAKAKLGIAGYQLWLAAAWRIGGRLGDRMTGWMAGALKVPADPAEVGSCMNYPYDIAWTGSHGGYRGRVQPVALTCPVFFAYGRRKPFMFHSPAWAEALAARPGSRVLALPTGHWVMREQPQAFNAAVDEWLAA